MRVILQPSYRQQLFGRLAARNFNVSMLSRHVNVSPRTLTDWRRGKYTLPETAFIELAKLAGIPTQSLRPQLQPDSVSKRRAGQLGAASTIAKYGLPGSLESRRRGGIRSYQVRRRQPGSIFQRKVIQIPGKSEQLAEFAGIMIGDGNMTPYQVSIALNSVDDAEYADYVAGLIGQLFGLLPRTSYRRSARCLVHTVSSVSLVEFLLELGLPVGNKVAQHHSVPEWIRADRLFEAACLRGVFDTDGCIFQEVHNVRGRRYSYPRMSFVSASAPLRTSIYDMLSGLDFSPRLRNNRSVNLEQRGDISRYFEEVGTSNPKHAARYNRFGGVG